MKKFVFNLQRFAKTVTTATDFANAIKNGETDIIVNGTFTVSSTLNITKSCKITINSGKTITYSGGGKFLAVNSGVNFQLVNNGTITSANQVNLIQNNGTTTVTGSGKIQCTNKGDTIKNNSGATFINNGNTIYSKNNGAVLNQGTFKQTSGILDSNNAGMYNEGTAYIYGGTVISGQMAIVNSKNLYVYGGTIGHSANTHGIYSSKTSARAYIYGGTIYGKTWAVESIDGTNTCNIYGGKFNNRITGWFWIVGGEFKESAPTVNEGKTQKIGDYHVVYNTSQTNNSVCQVNNRYFASLQAGFDYANTLSNPTVKLLKNVDIAETITVSKSFTLNLNGKNITRPSDASSDKIFIVNSGATMTVTGSGTVTNYNNDVFKVNSGGTLKLNGGTFQSTSNNAVWTNGGTLTVSGATLKSTNSNAIHNGGTVTINSGTISSTSSSAPTILNDSGKTVNVNGGTVSSSGNFAITNKGGTINVTNAGSTVKSTAKVSIYNNGGKVTVSNGTVTSSKGSGIYSYSSGTVEVSGGNVYSTGGGHGVYLGDTSNITVSGSGQVYSSAGHGIFTSSSGTITVSGGKVYSTSASGSGINSSGSGKITVSRGSVYSSGNQYFGISKSGTAAIEVTGGNIWGNTAIKTENDSGDITVSGGSVEGTNIGINNTKGATVTVEGGTVSGKSANTTAILNGGGKVTVTSGIVKADTENGVAISNTSTNSDAVKISGGTVQATGNNGTAIKNTASGNLSISGSSTITGTTYGINNSGTGKITVDNSSATVKATGGTGIYTSKASTTEIKAGTVSGSTYGINNANSSGKVEINGANAKVESSDTGIINSGTLNITQGTVTGTKTGINNAAAGNTNITGSSTVTIGTQNTTTTGIENAGTLKIENDNATVYGTTSVKSTGDTSGITKGKFSTNIKNLLQSGYSSVLDDKNSDGKQDSGELYQVYPGICYTQSGSEKTYCASITDDKITAGSTVYLLDNIETTAPITINKNITLDLNGKTISGSTNIFTVDKDKTLTIQDSITDTSKQGKITSTNTDHLSTIVNDGTVEIKSGTVLSEGAGIAAINNSANLTISGGTVGKSDSENAAISGSGSDCKITVSNGSVASKNIAIDLQNSATVEVTGGTVEGSSVAAIHNDGGETKVTGGEVKSSAIAVQAVGGSVEVSGNSKISVTDSGNAIYGTNATVNVKGGEISADKGKGIYLGSGTLTVETSAKITSTSGTAIDSYGTTEIKGGEITGSNGFYNGGTATILGGTISGATTGENIAGRYGVKNGGKITISGKDAVIKGNVAFISSSGHTITDGYFSTDVTPYLDTNTHTATKQTSGDNNGLYDVNGIPQNFKIKDKTTWYEKLEDAINAASAGDTIEVNASDTKITTAIELSKKITIDLKGKTISADTNGSFKISADGNLTITDTETTAGTFGAKITNEGTLSVESGTVTTVENNSGTTEIKGGTVSTVSANKGRLSITGGTATTITSSSGTLNIAGGSATTVTSTGTAKISGGTVNSFTNNTNGNLTVTGGTTTTLTNSSTANISNGATVTNLENKDNSGNLTVDGGTISKFSNSGTATINDGTISNTDASGTAVENKDNGNLTINGGTISGSTAISASGGKVVVNDGTINSSSDSGKTAISVTGTIAETMIVTGGTFYGSVTSSGNSDTTQPLKLQGGSFYNTNSTSQDDFKKFVDNAKQTENNQERQIFNASAITGQTQAYEVSSDFVCGIENNGSTTYYKTIGSAISAVNDNTNATTIKLIKNIELTNTDDQTQQDSQTQGKITISNKKIELDLNGHKITKATDFSGTELIAVESNGELKIITTNGGSISSDTSVAVVKSSGTLTIDEQKITSTGDLTFSNIKNITFTGLTDTTLTGAGKYTFNNVTYNVAKSENNQDAEVVAVVSAENNSSALKSGTVILIDVVDAENKSTDLPINSTTENQKTVKLTSTSALVDGEVKITAKFENDATTLESITGLDVGEKVEYGGKTYFYDNGYLIADNKIYSGVTSDTNLLKLGDTHEQGSTATEITYKKIDSSKISCTDTSLTAPVIFGTGESYQSNTVVAKLTSTDNSNYALNYIGSATSTTATYTVELGTITNLTLDFAATVSTSSSNEVTINSKKFKNAYTTTSSTIEIYASEGTASLSKGKVEFSAGTDNSDTMTVKLTDDSIKSIKVEKSGTEQTPDGKVTVEVTNGELKITGLDSGGTVTYDNKTYKLDGNKLVVNYPDQTKTIFEKNNDSTIEWSNINILSPDKTNLKESAYMQVSSSWMEFDINAISSQYFKDNSGTLYAGTDTTYTEASCVAEITKDSDTVKIEKKGTSTPTVNILLGGTEKKVETDFNGALVNLNPSTTSDSQPTETEFTVNSSTFKTSSVATIKTVVTDSNNKSATAWAGEFKVTNTDFKVGDFTIKTDDSGEITVGVNGGKLEKISGLSTDESFTITDKDNTTATYKMTSLGLEKSVNNTTQLYPKDNFIVNDNTVLFAAILENAWQNTITADANGELTISSGNESNAVILNSDKNKILGNLTVTTDAQDTSKKIYSVNHNTDWTNPQIKLEVTGAELVANFEATVTTSDNGNFTINGEKFTAESQLTLSTKDGGAILTAGKISVSDHFTDSDNKSVAITGDNNPAVTVEVENSKIKSITGLNENETVTYNGATYQLVSTEIISGNNIYTEKNSETNLVDLTTGAIVYQQIGGIEFALSDLNFDSNSAFRIGTDANYSSATYKADVTKSGDNYTLTLKNSTDKLIVDVNSETTINNATFSPKDNTGAQIVVDTSTRAYNGDFTVKSSSPLNAKKITAATHSGTGEDQTITYIYSETKISTSGEISINVSEGVVNSISSLDNTETFTVDSVTFTKCALGLTKNQQLYLTDVAEINLWTVSQDSGWQDITALTTDAENNLKSITITSTTGNLYVVNNKSTPTKIYANLVKNSDGNYTLEKGKDFENVQESGADADGNPTYTTTPGDWQNRKIIFDSSIRNITFITTIEALIATQSTAGTFKINGRTFTASTALEIFTTADSATLQNGTVKIFGYTSTGPGDSEVKIYDELTTADGKTARMTSAKGNNSSSVDVEVKDGVITSITGLDNGEEVEYDGKIYKNVSGVLTIGQVMHNNFNSTMNILGEFKGGSEYVQVTPETASDGTDTNNYVLDLNRLGSLDAVYFGTALEFDSTFFATLTKDNDTYKITKNNSSSAGSGKPGNNDFTGKILIDLTADMNKLQTTLDTTINAATDATYTVNGKNYIAKSALEISAKNNSSTLTKGTVELSDTLTTTGNDTDASKTIKVTSGTVEVTAENGEVKSITGLNDGESLTYNGTTYKKVDGALIIGDAVYQNVLDEANILNLENEKAAYLQITDGVIDMAAAINKFADSTVKYVVFGTKDAYDKTYFAVLTRTEITPATTPPTYTYNFEKNSATDSINVDKPTITNLPTDNQLNLNFPAQIKTPGAGNYNINGKDFETLNSAIIDVTAEGDATPYKGKFKVPAGGEFETPDGNKFKTVSETEFEVNDGEVDKITGNVELVKPVANEIDFALKGSLKLDDVIYSSDGGEMSVNPADEIKTLKGKIDVELPAGKKTNIDGVIYEGIEGSNKFKVPAGENGIELSSADGEGKKSISISKDGKKATYEYENMTLQANELGAKILSVADDGSGNLNVSNNSEEKIKISGTVDKPYTINKQYLHIEGDKDGYEIVLDDKGEVAEIDGISNGAVIYDANGMTLKTDSTGKFKFKNDEIEIQGDSEVYFKIDDENNLSGVSGLDDGAVVTGLEEIEINGRKVTVANNESRITFVTEGGDLDSIEGVTNGAKITGAGDAKIKIPDNSTVTIDGTEFKLNGNGGTATVSGKNITNVTPDAQLTISSAGKYSVNGLEIEVTAGQVLTVDKANSPYIYDPEADAAFTENLLAGDNVYIGSEDTTLDLENTNKALVVATEGANLTTYNPSNLTSFLLGDIANILAAIRNQSITFSDNKVNFFGKSINLGEGSALTSYSTILNNRNLTETRNVSWSSNDGGAVDDDDRTHGKILIGNYSGNKNSADLKAGRSNYYIFAGSGDTIQGGGGNNSIELNHFSNFDKGSSVVVNSTSGVDSVKGFTGGYNDNSDKLTVDDTTNLSMTFKNGKLQVKNGRRKMLFDDVKTNTTSSSADGENFIHNSTDSGDVVRLMVGSGGVDSKYAVAGENSTIRVENWYDAADIYIGSGKTSALDFEQYNSEVEVNLQTENYKDIGIVAGGFKNHTLIGGAERETLIAGTGAGSVWGAGGCDLLSGYDGEEKEWGSTFYFMEGDGKDTITNFEAFDEYWTHSADTLSSYGQEITGAYLLGDDVEFRVGNGQDLVRITDAKNKLLMVDNGELHGVRVGDSLAYDDFTTDFIGQGNSTITISDYATGDINIWLDGSDGKFYNGVKVLDASNAKTFSSLVGANGNEKIIAGEWNSSLWGGFGGNDTLIGGAENDEFFYSFGNGKDIISNATEDDVVNVFNTDLSQITKVSATNSQIKISFSDYGSLIVNSAENVGFKYQGVIYQLDRQNISWSEK